MQQRIYIYAASVVVSTSAILACDELIDRMIAQTNPAMPLLALCTAAIAAFCLGRLAVVKGNVG